MFADESGRETSHLIGMLYRTLRLLTEGIRPLYVFDGKPPELKSSELGKRRELRAAAEEELERAEEAGNAEDIEKFSKRTVRVTPEHNAECQRLLTLMGVPWIVAPCEAEATCAALARAGLVYAAGSEDMDTLTFRTPVLLRNLTAAASKKLDIMEVDGARVLAGLGLTHEQFVDLCILCGCDYTDTIRGIGPKRALALIKEHGSIEAAVASLDTTKYEVPADWKFAEARALFLNPDVVDTASLSIAWGTAPDAAGLSQFLVDERGFDASRVTRAIEKLAACKGKTTQTHMDAFFGRAEIVVNPNKRKRAEEQKASAKAGAKKAKLNGGAAASKMGRR